MTTINFCLEWEEKVKIDIDHRSITINDVCLFFARDQFVDMIKQLKKIDEESI